MYKDINYDKKIDIWSIGCILYELTTLTVPFQANDIIKLKKKIINGYYYDKIPDIYSKDIQSMIHFLLDVNVEKRPNIKEILSTKIFKKKEHELNLFNQNNFNINIHDKLHNQYSPPKVTYKWNLLIDDIDKFNDNKSPKFIDKKYNFENINHIYNKSPNYNNISNNNKLIPNYLPSINNFKKTIEKPKYISDNYQKNEKKYKNKYENKYINRSKLPKNNSLYDYDYPKLPKIQYNYYKYKNYNDKFYKPSINNNLAYPKVFEYNDKYYKNKYEKKIIIL